MIFVQPLQLSADFCFVLIFLEVTLLWRRPLGTVSLKLKIVELEKLSKLAFSPGESMQIQGFVQLLNFNDAKENQKLKWLNFLTLFKIDCTASILVYFSQKKSCKPNFSWRFWFCNLHWDLKSCKSRVNQNKRAAQL